MHIKCILISCLLLAGFPLTGCNRGDDSGFSDPDGDQSHTDGDGSDGDLTAGDEDQSSDGDLADDERDEESEIEFEPEDTSPIRFTAVTFNTGTSEAMGHDMGPDDGYTDAHAAISDEWYGDGLAWLPAVAATKDFFEAVDPDIVVFQEVFYSGECPSIPQEAWPDFICETWQEGDPTVALQVLGEGWQLMCHPGKPDKCAAVNRRFGSFRGCEQDFCLEGLDGFKVETCGSGSRIGRGLIDLVGGGTLTLVNVHGSSGISSDDQNCREKQFMQVFEDFGDGQPAANGLTNLVLGDFNTDPARMDSSDPSARKINEHAGEGKPFHFHTKVGLDAPGTYAGLFNIDHVLSDKLLGSCRHPGVSEGHDPVTDAKYFDHVPAVCELEMVR